MTPAVRLTRHRRMAEGFVHALSVGPELGRIEFPPEWTVRSDAVQWLPTLGEEHGLGQYLVDHGLSHSERATAEFHRIWKHLPDFRVIESGEPIVGAEGFSVWIRMEGTQADGTTVAMWEFDTFRTDENGDITRYEAMFDRAEFMALLGVVTGLSSDVTWDDWRGAMK